MLNLSGKEWVLYDVTVSEVCIRILLLVNKDIKTGWNCNGLNSSKVDCIIESVLCVMICNHLIRYLNLDAEAGNNTVLFFQFVFHLLLEISLWLCVHMLMKSDVILEMG